MGSPEPQRKSLTEEIENELKTIPKINILKSKSSVYGLNLDQLRIEGLKARLTMQLNYFWTVCHYSSKQKKAFEHIHTNLRKDGSETKGLAFYDAEVKYLKQYYENNKQIFELLDLYKQQLVKMKNTLSESEKTMLGKNASDTEKRLKKFETHYRLLNGKDLYTHGITISEYIGSLPKER